MSARRKGPSIAALVAAMLAFNVTLALSSTAQEDFIPSVSVAPADTNPEDPNGGQWFFIELSPGEAGRVVARVTNPADVAQDISFFIRDLDFNDEGEAFVNFGQQFDVGLWGVAEVPQARIDPGTSVNIGFRIVPPSDAEPGDHIGVVVAEGQPQGEDVTITTRVATRLYVTIPGEAERSFEIVSLDIAKDSSFWPRSALVTASLRNTGRVRLQPSVRIKDSQARGSRLLLSRSVEPYIADVHIPWWGGLIRIPVEAEIPDGSVRRVNKNLFVIPWGLLVILGLAGVAGWRGKRWWVTRVSRVEALRADLKRIEQLLAQRPVGPREPEFSDADEEQDDIQFGAIQTGLKQARRTESWAAMTKLAISLHELNGKALPPLIEALGHADVKDMPELVGAIRSYPRKDLDSNSDLAKLPADILDRILEGSEGEAPSRSASSTPKRSKKPSAKKKSASRKPKPRAGKPKKKAAAKKKPRTRR
jgi:dihydroorotate dehydrogenase (fumarate)